MSIVKHPLIKVAARGYIGWRFDKDHIQAVLAILAKSVARDARQAVEGSSGSGREYSRPGGGYYKASAPLALPASRSGNLARSIIARFSKDKLAGFIGPATPFYKPKNFYPAFLLYGAKRGKAGGVMEKRRGFMGPAARRYRMRFNREMAAAMQTSIKPVLP